MRANVSVNARTQTTEENGTKSNTIVNFNSFIPQPGHDYDDDDDDDGRR